MPMRSTPEPTMLRIKYLTAACVESLSPFAATSTAAQTITTSKKIYMLNKSSDTVTAIKDASSTRNTP